MGSGSRLLSRTVSSTVPSAAPGLTIVFGMGTGVSPERIATGIVSAPQSLYENPSDSQHLRSLLCSILQFSRAIRKGASGALPPLRG